jgi:sorbitol/mannitol transport system substrate-binding protein
MSTAMGGSEFDVVMISNFETPQWAKTGWLTNLSDYISQTPGYDEDDFISSLRESLSYEGDMYSVPFYGESSFLMYRKDLFEQAGIKVPQTPNYQPTWQEVADWAKKLKTDDRAGICLRGKPGWGELLAPLDTVINTFGGRWFDEQWNATLNSPEVHKAVNFYVNLLNDAGELGASSAGFQECANLFGQGQTAMWYDATSAAGSLDGSGSPVAGKVGYVPAPVNKTKASGWLYTWAWAIEKASKNQAAAWKFISWASGKSYINLVGQKLGWAQIPPGTRTSTYSNPNYLKKASAFAKPTITAIDSVDPNNPGVQPRPTSGIQFVDIPEFTDFGTKASQLVSNAIAGQISVSNALKQSQSLAQSAGDKYKS